jgi:hypothetical protein
MPAKAGIHDFFSPQQGESWIPVFAGMTGWAQNVRRLKRLSRVER